MNTPDDPFAPGPADKSSATSAGNLLQGADDLLRELTRMAGILRPYADAAPDGPLTAVVRLAPGLDPEQWRRLASDNRCDGWFALELPKRAQPVPAPELCRGEGGKPAEDPFGILNVAPFLERLHREAERARQIRSGLALALFAVTEAPGGEGAKPDALAELGGKLRQAARPQDVMGRLQPDMLALAMPGVGPFQALALAERVVSEVSRVLGLPHDGDPAARLSPEKSGCLLKAGVAEIPGEGGAEAEAAAVLERAKEALRQTSDSAAASVRERVRLFRRSADPAERETLVLASEKQFLFFGGS